MVIVVDQWGHAVEQNRAAGDFLLSSGWQVEVLYFGY